MNSDARSDGQAGKEPNAGDDGETESPRWQQWVQAWLPERLARLVLRVADRELLVEASSLAFYGLVSALPLLLIAFTVVEAVMGEDTLRSFIDEVDQSGPEGTGQFLDQLEQQAGLTVATLLFAIWPATAYGGGLRRALIKGAQRQETAPGLRGRLIALGMVLALPVLLLAGIPTMFVVLNLLQDGVWMAVLGAAAALLIGAVVGTVVITLLYRAFSPEDLAWRDTALGAGLCAVITAFFSLGFVIYLNVGAVEDRFGGGTTAVVVMLGVWLFVANILLLAGYRAVLQLEEEG